VAHFPFEKANTTLRHTLSPT